MSKNYGKKKTNFRGKTSGRGKAGYTGRDGHSSKHQSESLDTFSTRSGNHDSWYSSDDAILRDTASVAYGYALGAPVNLLGYRGAGSQYFSELSKTSLPGVAAIHWCPTIGKAASANDAVNLAARSIYTETRSANSRTANYDASDEMLYALALDSAYSFHEMLKRLYGVMNWYTPINRYFPRALVKAMGFDFEDIQEHLPQLRAYMNVYALNLQRFYIPGTMPYYQRHQWMNQKLFVDDNNTTKAQTYMFVQDYFFKYEETTEGEAGYLKALRFTGDGSIKTYADIKEFGNELLSVILASEDLMVISADIANAYGDRVYQLQQTPDTYMVLPEYDEEALNQIHNATLLGTEVMASDGTEYKIRQDTAIVDNRMLLSTPIVFNPLMNEEVFKSEVVNAAAAVYSNTKLVSMYKDNPEPKDTMKATRLTVIPATAEWDGDNFGLKMAVTDSGSELGLFMQYYAFDVVNNQWTTRSRKVTSVTYCPINLDDYSAIEPDRFIQVVTDLAVFDYHPFTWPVVVATQGEEVTVSGSKPLGDIDNFTVLDANTLNTMHNYAILSEFRIL